MPAKSKPRRTRVPGEANRSIYRRQDATGKTVYEVGYRTASGSQSFRTTGHKLTEARAERDRMLGSRVKIDNARMKFGQAADEWLKEQVVNLSPNTQSYYRECLRHLRPNWDRRRMDRISVTDAARLVSDLRASGYSESTINGVLVTAGRVFRYAMSRNRWHGENPISQLDASDRAKVSDTEPRRYFTAEELDQTINAAQSPWRLMFAFTATTGARISEVAGLVWGDLDLVDLSAAAVSIDYQVDRAGKRRKLKTRESRRRITLPRFLAVELAELKAGSPFSKPEDFVFCTRTGAAISQRNLARALRRTQAKAVTPGGKPTFPLLHVKDENGKPVKPPRNSIPSWHGFRHSAASEAIAAGDSIEDVADRLGHRSTIITETIYRHQLKSAARDAAEREATEARYGNRWQQMAASDGREPQNAPADSAGEVVNLQAKRSKRK